MTCSDKLIHLVEAAYRLDLDEAAWLARIAGHLRPFLPEGSAYLAFSYREHGMGFLLREVLTQAPTTLFVPAPGQEALLPSGEDALALRCFSHSDAVTLSSLDVSLHAEWARATGATPHTDLLVLTAREGTDLGLGFAVLLPASSRVPASLQRIWKKTSVHLASALRIRAALGRGTGLAPREQLRQLCRADLPLPQPLLDGADLWRELAEGRCSLLEEFDDHERHYFVLKRHSAASRDPRALSEREAEVLELAARGDTDRTIAARLGVSNSTVATHRTRAMEKLGLRSRAVLGHLMQGLGVEVSEGAPPASVMGGARHG